MMEAHANNEGHVSSDAINHPARIIDPRAEGVYVTSSIYPPEGGDFSTRLFKIESVSGNGSVHSIELTRAEANELRTELLFELRKS